MFYLKSAKVTLLCNNEVYCCVFPPKIVIGNVENDCFVNEYFIFNKEDYFDLYKGITDTIKFIAEEYPTNKGIILEKDNLMYFWTVKVNESTKEQIIILGIERSCDIIYKICFNQRSFNDFINILSHLILPSLNSNCLYILHSAIVKCDLKQLIGFKNAENCRQFLVEIDEKDENLIISLMYYREILIIVSKLKSLYNSQYEECNIQRLLDD